MRLSGQMVPQCGCGPLDRKMAASPTRISAGSTWVEAFPNNCGEKEGSKGKTASGLHGETFLTWTSALP